MIALHLTESKNINSIMKKGLLPSVVKLDHHLDTFKEEGLNGNSILYAWEDCDKNDKFAKDMIYCKQWIDTRNRTVEQNCCDFSKDRKKYFFNNSYSLLLINIDLIEEGFFGRYIHEQTPTKDKYNSLFNMDCRFAHDDKKLCLFFNKIDSCNIKIIETYITNVDKNNKLIINNNN